MGMWNSYLCTKITGRFGFECAFDTSPFFRTEDRHFFKKINK